jgi:methylamine dehydrogenase heavy chain
MREGSVNPRAPAFSGARLERTPARRTFNGRRRTVAGTLLVTLCMATAAAAAPEEFGRSRTLPAAPGPHWFWLSDIVLHRTALFDADAGELLGTISAGTAGVGFVIAPEFSADHREIYIPETYYARGVRGERTDVVTVYDTKTLGPVAEIPIPARRAEYFPGNAANALLDDGRFLVVFNLTPMTSVSIVDVRARRFVTEVPTPGCSLVFAAGPRRFFMLCANGGALVVTLDEDGGTAKVERAPPFFDAAKDPITEKAVRRGNEWFFVSFEGVMHPLDLSGDQLRPGEKWSLVDADDRRDSWRIGGAQHLAVHGASGKLYALMHQGPVDSHKAAGTEIWVYDLAARRRLRRIPTLSPLASFVGLQMGGPEAGGMARFVRWLVGRAAPNLGVDAILVTQDAAPVLVAASVMPPAVTVYDAATGAVVREIPEVGLALSLLYAP